MDRVICPIFKKEVTQEFCLKHSMEDVPTPCGYEYVLLKKMFEENDRSGIHATDLLGCLKRTILDKTNPVPEPVPAKLARVLGTLTHAILEQKEASPAHSECHVTRDGLVGTVDVYYPELKRVVDLKTTRWLKPSLLPYGTHKEQVNIYAWMLEGMGFEVEELFLQYIDLSGPTKCRKCKILLSLEGSVLTCPRCGSQPKDAHMGALMIQVEKSSEEVIGSLVRERMALVEAGLKTGEVEAETSWLCFYCSHSNHCPEGREFTGG